MYVDIFTIDEEQIRFLQLDDQKLGRISNRVRRRLRQEEEKKEDGRDHDDGLLQCWRD